MPSSRPCADSHACVGSGFGRNLTLQISEDCENSNSVPSAAPPAIGDACSIAPANGLQPGFLSPETYLFARSEYQYMRFGLGFTLMKDGCELVAARAYSPSQRSVPR